MVWAKKLGLDSTGHAGGAQSNEETFSCDSIVTTYFDPTNEWVAKCLTAKPVDDYIVGSGYKNEVYIITGLKVATNLTFGNEAARNVNTEVKIGVNVPQDSVVVGLEGPINKEKVQELRFKSSDIIVGFRVKKYRYKKKGLFRKGRELESQLFIKGAEMLDNKTGPVSSTKLNQFEEAPIPEEDIAQSKYEEMEDHPVHECWVD